MSVESLFSTSAGLHPGAVALVCEGRKTTYAELDALVATEAERLESLRGHRVALWAHRRVETYVSYLTIQRIGASVVPLNPEHPTERTHAVITAAGAVDPRATSIPRPGPEAAGCGPGEIYVLFTSGSTGRPKGIPITSDNLAAFVRHNVARYGVGVGDRLSQTFGLTFDPSVFDMAVAWAAGATLVVPSREELIDPVSFVRRQQITHWYSVPSLIAAAQASGELVPNAMPGLRWSLFAGEQLRLDAARAWAEAAPGSVVENLYGPTELTITVTAHRLAPDPADWPETSNATVPIGTAYPHLEAEVDPASGELRVRGSQRFAGYLDAAADAHAFDPPLAAGEAATPEHWYRTGDRVSLEDGAWVHRDRIDRQVKLAGQRVELGEIEAALRRCAQVRDAVVVPPGDMVPRLVALCLGEPREAAEIRADLRAHLPGHMIPRRYVWLESYPLTPNGKVDLAACSALAC